MADGPTGRRFETKNAHNIAKAERELSRQKSENAEKVKHEVGNVLDLSKCKEKFEQDEAVGQPSKPLSPPLTPQSSHAVPKPRNTSTTQPNDELEGERDIRRGLEKDLDNANKRIKELCESLKEASEAQTHAAGEGPDELSKQKRIVAELKGLLDDANAESSRLRGEIMDRDAKVFELEREARSQRVREQQESEPPLDGDTDKKTSRDTDEKRASHGASAGARKTVSGRDAASSVSSTTRGSCRSRGITRKTIRQMGPLGYPLA